MIAELMSFGDEKSAILLQSSRDCVKEREMLKCRSPIFTVYLMGPHLTTAMTKKIR